MSLRTLFWFSVFLLTSLSSPGQIKVKFTGIVKDKESYEGLSDVVIVIECEEKKIATTSDSVGNYSFLNSKVPRRFTITLSKMGYHKSIRVVDANSFTNNNINIYNLPVLELMPSAINLKEVVVKKRRRYSDTTKIDLTKESFERSVMIDDLFSQKGFSRSSTGQLYYKGAPVVDIKVNGRDFFGKSNMGIFDKIPALTLEGVQVIESNIDSITNSTLLRPVTKVNLILKHAYRKGRFGSASNGIGTRSRKLINAELFSYKNNQQISLSGGHNNVGLNSNIGEPVLAFSINGNNATKNFGKITYTNSLAKGLDINLVVDASNENRELDFVTERREQRFFQNSKTVSLVYSENFKIDLLEGSVSYKISDRSKIEFSSKYSYDNAKNNDSLNYFIENLSSQERSYMNRDRSSKSTSFINKVRYQKRFVKEGRSYFTELSIHQNDYSIDEILVVNDSVRTGRIIGYRGVDNLVLNTVTEFTEPIGEYFSITAIADLKKAILANSMVVYQVDPPDFLNEGNTLNDTYLSSGIRMNYLGRHIMLTGEMKGIVNERCVDTTDFRIQRFKNLDLQILLDNKITDNRNFQISYILRPNYPSINQLTNINASFDLISQNRGNVFLRPERMHSLRGSYDIRKSDSLKFSVSTKIEYRLDAFGIRSEIDDRSIPILFPDNIGNSISGSISFSTFANLKQVGFLNYVSTFSYNELPNILNGIKDISRGFSLSNVISSTQTIFKDCTVSPVFSVMYNRFNYSAGRQKSIAFNYSDKINYVIFGAEFVATPFVNLVNNGENSRFGWLMNIEVRKKIIRNYGIVWIKGHNIFNSFRFDYNIFEPSYVQINRYSNLTRYFMAGLTFKFNSIR